MENLIYYFTVSPDGLPSPLPILLMLYSWLYYHQQCISPPLCPHIMG